MKGGMQKLYLLADMLSSAFRVAGYLSASDHLVLELGCETCFLYRRLLLVFFAVPLGGTVHEQDYSREVFQAKRARTGYFCLNSHMLPWASVDMPYPQVFF